MSPRPDVVLQAPTGGAEIHPPLPYARQWIGEDDIASVVEVLRSEWLTQGPAVIAFEQALANRCGSRFAVAVNSGTAALHLACLAAGLGPGDVGVTSPITFVASANCIAYCGGTPMFADIDPNTATIDPIALERACASRRPKVIIPVDFAGQPADLPAIRRVADRYGSVVIEDAAHALGARYEHEENEFNVGACAHSDMAVFSFHPVKHITTGEGGAVLTNSEAFYARLIRLRTHGITRDPGALNDDHGPWYYEQHDLGFNYRITDIQCALGLSQLRKLSFFVEKRRELVEQYRERLSGLGEEVDLLLESPGKRSSYHILVGKIRGGAERRRRVFDALCRENIRPQVHYIPVHLQPWYRRQYGFVAGQFPYAETYYEHCLSLPLFAEMTHGDVERSVRALKVALMATR